MHAADVRGEDGVVAGFARHVRKRNRRPFDFGMGVMTTGANRAAGIAGAHERRVDAVLPRGGLFFVAFLAYHDRGEGIVARALDGFRVCRCVPGLTSVWQSVQALAACSDFANKSAGTTIVMWSEFSSRLKSPRLEWQPRQRLSASDTCACAAVPRTGRMQTRATTAAMARRVMRRATGEGGLLMLWHIQIGRVALRAEVHRRPVHAVAIAAVERAVV